MSYAAHSTKNGCPSYSKNFSCYTKRTSKNNAMKCGGTTTNQQKKRKKKEKAKEIGKAGFELEEPVTHIDTQSGDGLPSLSTGNRGVQWSQGLIAYSLNWPKG
eukprot:gene13259-9102_t